MSRVKPRKSQRLAAKKAAVQALLNHSYKCGYEMGRHDQNRDTCRWVSERTSEDSLVRDYRRFDVKEFRMQSVILDDALGSMPKDCWMEHERSKFISSLCQKEGGVFVEEQKLPGITSITQSLYVAFKPKD